MHIIEKVQAILPLPMDERYDATLVVYKRFAIYGITILQVSPLYIGLREIYGILDIV